MVIPSRQENPPKTGVEAHACGTPVAAFNTCGLPDIVEHQRNGYLAKAFDTEDLAKGIAWVLAQHASEQLGQQARERAVARFSEIAVAESYGVVNESAML